MRIVECEQLSPLWWESKRGIPSASNAHRIITPKTGKLSASADEYAHELIAERIRFDPPIMSERALSPAIQAGIDGEPEARRWFSFDTGLEVRQVGLCVSDCGRWCASPDGLIGDDGALELKVPMPKTHVGYLLADKLPDEYRPQTHFQLVTTGLKYVWFVSYCPGFPALKVRVTPNDFTDQLRVCLEMFSMRLAELAAMLSKRVP